MLLQKLAGVVFLGTMLVIAGCKTNDDVKTETETPAVAP